MPRPTRLRWSLLATIAGIPAISVIGAGPAIVRAENLFPQGHFDDAASALGWVSALGSGGAAFEPAADADACPRSGSLELHNDSAIPGELVMIARCLGAVEPSLALTAGLSGRFLEEAPGAELEVLIAFLTGADCTGDFAGIVGEELEAEEPGVWQALSFPVDAPPAAASVEVVFLLIHGEDAAPTRVDVDELHLRSATDLFFDDFEQEATCRWSGPRVGPAPED